MTEQTGIARAIEVLGEKLADTEKELRVAQTELSLTKELHKDANARLMEQLHKNYELTQQLEQARAAEEAASSYALKLERLLEECRKAYEALKEGGAQNCKKSQ